MKNILLKLICVYTLIFWTANVSKAQLVYIPDPNFRAYLNQNFSSCMVGDSIDSSCPAVLSATSINVNSLNIADLSGLEVFVNCTHLYCYNNFLSDLPFLPWLVDLNCTNNQITSIPYFPPNLIYIDCAYNQLTYLPTLPSTVSDLNCSGNLLISLPSLPFSLTTLQCENNLITSLPIIPNTLFYLYCHNNQLTSLPTSLSSLKNFGCDNNQLSALPTLPATLRNLSCNSNLLSSLPTLPASLEGLNCYDNQLTSLPTLPPMLNQLWCNDNQITSLPSLPPLLIQLWCNDNQITSLPTLPPLLNYLKCENNQLTSLPTLPPTLKTLVCNNNQFASLPILPSPLTSLYCQNNQITVCPSLPSSLKNFRCDSNLLTSLPTLPSTLITLECNNNQLTSLPPLPFSLTALYCQNNGITCLPDLKEIKYLDFSGNQINCLPGYGNLLSSIPSFIGYPLCDVFNSNNCEIFWNIEGSVFFDIDSNCNNDTNEPFFKNQKINLYKNGVLDQQTFTNVNGDYDFDTFSFDLYKTEMDTMGLPFEVYCPTPGFYIDTISTADSVKYDRDFGMKCKDVDLAVTSIFSNNLRPASIREIKIQAGDYTNYFGAHCAAGIGGTVNITITGACNYFSPSQGAITPNTIIGNVLTYNVADFGVLSYDSSFNFNILMDTSAALGSQICIQVSISTPSAEINYNNNLLSQCFTVVGSFDPNDKSVYPTSTLDISGNRWLTYLIRFQNTGTADAEHIYITDTLSASLDWSTFNLLSSSHQPHTQVYNDGLIKFSFPNIHLPDSNTNEPASHGSVQYKIRAKDSLAIGITIENTANIFFDFNAPVITNTTSNTIINCAIPPTTVSATLCQGEMFILNSAVYFSPGTYYQTILTSQGCDSTVILNITILPHSENHISDSICDGTSLNFNGQILNTAGIFIDTLVNSIGCDSIVYFNLSLLPKLINQNTQRICEGNTFNFNGQSLTLPGQYSYTVDNSIGCDSLVILDLIIVPTYNQFNITICNGSSFTLGNQTLTSPGNYIDTLINSIGCDSIVSLNLQFTNHYQIQQSVSICQNDNYYFAGNLISQAGIYFDSLQTIIGCDSVIILDLQTIPISTSQISATICVGITYNFNGQLIFNPGIYTDTLMNFLGCDSIINLNLQMNQSPTFFQSVTTCNYESFLFNGNILTQSGTYYDSLLSTNGCDSIIELQLNVTGLTNVITQTSNTLQTQATGSAYVWINCATNQFIFGASGPSFQPFQSGNYAVAVTYGNCIDTSSCFSFSMVGLPSSIGADVIFQTHYNSNADQIQLHAEKLKGNKGILRLMDISGRIIFQKQIENIAARNLDVEIPAKGMNAGIYLLNLITERDNVSGKVVKY